MAEKRPKGKGVRYITIPPAVLSEGRIERLPYTYEEDPATPISDPPSPEDPPVPVATTISLTPLNAGIIIGQDVQITATILDQFGNAMDLLPNWTSSDTAIATVTQLGLVHGVAAGNATITAYYGSVESLSATSVQVSNPAITSVSVTPTSISAQAGAAAVTLTATTRDAQGNAWVNRTVTWTNNSPAVVTLSASSGYSVTATPIGAGTVDVVATCETVNSNTVGGTITAATDLSGRPNEPVGFTMITERTYASATDNGWTTPTGGAQINDSTTPPKSPPATWRFRKTAGATAGSMGSTEKNISAFSKSRLYICHWFRTSDDFYGHAVGICKQLFPKLSGYPYIFTSVYGVGSGTIRAAVSLQGCPPNIGGNNSSGERTMQSNGGGVYTRGQYHRVEYDITLNTSNTADGVLKVWVDGNLCINVTNLCVRGTTAGGGAPVSGANTKFSHIVDNPVWGGTGDTVPAGKSVTLYHDHIYVSG